MQLADLDLNKTYSYADYLQWSFEERLELIKGKIFKMTPAPAALHQRLSWIISGELYGYLKNKSCQAFAAPFDVRLTRRGTADAMITTVVQPDICVICDQSKLDSKGCTGAPDIVMEILSPGNNQKELQNKYDVYEESGVLEYWIISPQDKTFLKYSLITGKYQPSKLMTIGETVTSNILPGFELDLETIFASI